MLAFLLGTPETSLRGRNTRKALNALTSNPSFISIANTVLIILRTIKDEESWQFDDVVMDYLIDQNMRAYLRTDLLRRRKTSMPIRGKWGWSWNSTICKNEYKRFLRCQRDDIFIVRSLLDFIFYDVMKTFPPFQSVLPCKNECDPSSTRLFQSRVSRIGFRIARK